MLTQRISDGAQRLWILAVVAFAGCGQPAAQERVAAARDAAVSELHSLAYVPRDALAIVAARPAQLFERPVLAPVREAWLKSDTGGKISDVTPDEVREVRVAALANLERGVSFTILVRTTTADALRRIMGQWGAEREEAEYAGQKYWRLPQLGRASSFQADSVTLVFATDEPSLRRCLLAGPAGATAAAWAPAWAKVADQDAVALLNSSLVRGVPLPALAEFLPDVIDRRLASSWNGLFEYSALWKRTDYVRASLSCGERLELRMACQSATAEEASQAHSAFLNLIGTARLAVSLSEQAWARGDEGPAEALTRSLGLLSGAMEEAKVVVSERGLEWRAQLDASATGRLVSAAAPLLGGVSAAQARQQSSNNLKTLAIAMHNYHDTYKRFPAAVQLGPKGTPRSWRVTLLPFLDELEMYDQYRQEEPWDSPHNRQVTARMPDVFRAPLDERDSQHTSYFVLSGPGAVFDEHKQTGFHHITDGTSNTIMLVESKQATHWAKPEDIAFEAEGPLPRVGGWYERVFGAALCDGSSLFLPQAIHPQNFRNMILKDDGQVVDFP